MPARAEVVVRRDPASTSALVVVSGTAPETVAPQLQQVLHRAAEAIGPHVRVDLTGCEVVAPAVVEILRTERSRLVARGGSLACDGISLDGGPPPVPAALADRQDGAAQPDLSPEGPGTPSRLVAAVRRRTAAVDVGPERSAAGEQLLELLRLLGTVEQEQQA